MGESSDSSPPQEASPTLGTAAMAAHSHGGQLGNTGARQRAFACHPLTSHELSCTVQARTDYPHLVYEDTQSPKSRAMCSRS